MKTEEWRPEGLRWQHTHSGDPDSRRRHWPRSHRGGGRSSSRRRATGVEFDWHPFAAGADAFARPANTSPRPSPLHRANKSPSKGPSRRPSAADLPHQRHAAQTVRALRQLPPDQNLPGLETQISRHRYHRCENTEDLLRSGARVFPGVVESLKIITEKGSTRIAGCAFEYARRHGRKKIHAIHKANIMKLSDGLFLRVLRRAARTIPKSPTPSTSSTTPACSWS